MNIAAYVSAISAASYIAITSLYDLRGLLLLNAYNLILVIGGLVLPFWHRRGENFVAISLIALISIGQLYVVWMLGLNSSLHIFFLLAGATLFFFGTRNWKLFAVVFAYLVALLLIALDFAPAYGLLLPGDMRLRELVSSQTLISVAAINAALIFYALSLVQRAEDELELQHERSEALIAAVMPPAIAARLKASDERIADRIGNLSVLFADLVGFTTAAHDLAPETVVGFLDAFVRSLDALAERYGVDKIKTVGDSYMAVAGFDGRSAAGAVALGRFALAMLRANADLAPLGARKLDLRVGIHCGAATAGVIGDTRFTYDVWGDAVNVASRMESHGVPGRIHVSEDFRDLTKDVFTFDERGTMEIKGIGQTPTYFLTGVRNGQK